MTLTRPRGRGLLSGIDPAKFLARNTRDDGKPAGQRRTRMLAFRDRLEAAGVDRLVAQVAIERLIVGAFDEISVRYLDDMGRHLDEIDRLRGELGGLLDRVLELKQSDPIPADLRPDHVETLFLQLEEHLDAIESPSNYVDAMDRDTISMDQVVESADHQPVDAGGPAFVPDERPRPVDAPVERFEETTLDDPVAVARRMEEQQFTPTMRELRADWRREYFDDSGKFRDLELERLYEVYADGKGKAAVGREAWVRRTRGAGRDRLKELGALDPIKPPPNDAPWRGRPSHAEDPKIREAMQELAQIFQDRHLPEGYTARLRRLPTDEPSSVAQRERLRDLDPIFLEFGYEVQIVRSKEDVAKWAKGVQKQSRMPDGIRFLDDRHYTLLEHKEHSNYDTLRRVHEQRDRLDEVPQAERRQYEDILLMFAQDRTLAEDLEASGCRGFEYSTGDPRLDALYGEMITESIDPSGRYLRINEPGGG